MNQFKIQDKLLNTIDLHGTKISTLQPEDQLKHIKRNPKQIFNTQNAIKTVQQNFRISKQTPLHHVSKFKIKQILKASPLHYYKLPDQFSWSSSLQQNQVQFLQKASIVPQYVSSFYNLMTTLLEYQRQSLQSQQQPKLPYQKKVYTAIAGLKDVAFWQLVPTLIQTLKFPATVTNLPPMRQPLYRQTIKQIYIPIFSKIFYFFQKMKFQNRTQVGQVVMNTCLSYFMSQNEVKLELQQKMKKFLRQRLLMFQRNAQLVPFQILKDKIDTAQRILIEQQKEPQVNIFAPASKVAQFKTAANQKNNIDALELALKTQGKNFENMYVAYQNEITKFMQAQKKRKT